MTIVISKIFKLADPINKMDKKRKNQLPIVYSCSGCSSAAQTANSIALALDRLGLAEMSCIAGVGGDVPTLVAVAKSGRPLVVLDGCALQCARNCLKRHQVEPKLHYILSDFGIKKRMHTDFDPQQAKDLTERFKDDISSLTKKNTSFS